MRDAIVIGSGFGGSVSALRLVQKGHRVLLVEKGARLDAESFPRTNWDLPRWLWQPSLGWRGLCAVRFFRHLTVLHGAGYGGGSLGSADAFNGFDELKCPALKPRVNFA